MDKKCDYCDEQLLEWDYITNCGHSLCASCYRLDTGKCLLCKKQCEYRLIGEKMSTHGTKFLSPISRVLNDAQDIVEFQMSSLLRLVLFLRDKVERQRLLLQQVKQELSSVKDFKWELHHLREENELLKTKLKKQQEREKQKQKQENEKKRQDTHQTKHQEKQEEKKEQKEEEEEAEMSVDHEYQREEEEEEEEEEGSYQGQDNDSGLYYRPLRKEDFSSQEMSVWRRADPFSFQSRVDQLNFQNLF